MIWVITYRVLIFALLGFHQRVFILPIKIPVQSDLEGLVTTALRYSIQFSFVTNLCGDIMCLLVSILREDFFPAFREFFIILAVVATCPGIYLLKGAPSPFWWHGLPGASSQLIFQPLGTLLSMSGYLFVGGMAPLESLHSSFSSLWGHHHHHHHHDCQTLPLGWISHPSSFSSFPGPGVSHSLT